MLYAETTKVEKQVVIKVPMETKKAISPNEHNVKENLYKLLYENSVKSNNDIIGTIQWSIGLVATFIIVLLGSQVFFNYRVSKEEIKSIKSSIEEKISIIRVELTDAISQENKANSTSTRKSFATLEDSLQNNFIERFNEKEKYFDTKIESIEKSNQLLKNHLSSEVKDLSIKIVKMDGYIWKLRGVEVVALRNFVDTAYLIIEEGHEPKFILKEIVETLENITRISTDELSRLNELMDKVPQENITLKNQIESLYKELPLYTYVDDPNDPGSLKVVNI